jgi:hypothetical protein
VKREVDIEQTNAEKTCLQCSKVLKVLMFMGCGTDGYVCGRCKIYFNEELKPLARMLFCDRGVET